MAEVSSFQLALTETFRPAVAAWVNFSEDHLDWHATLDAYRAAKARVWANSGPGDVAVANAEDPAVLTASRTASDRGATVVTFGLSRGDYTVDEDLLVGPGGVVLAAVGELPRSLPHDLANALCAAAASLAVGATPEGCRRALGAFRGLPHRVELVGEASGVRFYDDSKATTPGAVLAALDGFSSAVLIAGGRNKGLDLSVLRGAAGRLRGVVAIGEAAAEVSAAFAGACTVAEAPSMADAVRQAAAMARTGDCGRALAGLRVVRLVQLLRCPGRRLRPVRPGPRHPRHGDARHRRARARRGRPVKPARVVDRRRRPDPQPGAPGARRARVAPAPSTGRCRAAARRDLRADGADRRGLQPVRDRARDGAGGLGLHVAPGLRVGVDDLPAPGAVDGPRGHRHVRHRPDALRPVAAGARPVARGHPAVA